MLLLISVYPHRTSLKNMPATVGIEPMTFGILAQCSCSQLSYAVRSVRAFDISELSLVPSISMQSSNMIFSVLLMLCTQVNMNNCYLINRIFFPLTWMVKNFCNMQFKTFD